MKTITALAAAAMLVGCATQPIPMYGPSGEVNYAVRCNAWTQCYAKASRICKKEGWYEASAQSRSETNQLWYNPVLGVYQHEIRREMLIGCGSHAKI